VQIGPYGVDYGCVCSETCCLLLTYKSAMNTQGNSLCPLRGKRTTDGVYSKPTNFTYFSLYVFPYRFHLHLKIPRYNQHIALTTSLLIGQLVRDPIQMFLLEAGIRHG